MAGRVNLNVPPRLIESARAAQYANREAQGARELDRRIEGKVRQQRQAAKRAQPQAQTIDGQGAVFDAPALKRVPRIWRKRRPLAGGNGYGIGYIVSYRTLYGNNKFRIYTPNGTAYAEIDETAVGFVPNPSGNHLGITGISGVALSENERCVSFTGQNGPSKVYWLNSANWTFLPAGNGNAIFIFSAYWAYIDFYLIRNANNSLGLGGYADGLKLVQKAFFVSSNAVQEITVGGGFKAFTENALLPVVWSDVRLLECEGNVFIGMIRLPNYLAPAPSPGFTSISAGSIGRSLDPYDRSFDYYSPVRFGDLDSGGIAPLLGFGPGIYSYLANPAAANAAVDAAGNGPWAKQAAAEQFIGTDLLPSGSLADSSINPKKALLYTGTYPPANRPFGTMSQFSDGTFNRAPSLLRYNLTPTDGVEDPLWDTQPEELKDSVLYREPFGGFVAPGPDSPLVPNTYTTPVLFWDWDNPDYCERQLLRLGFSEADLTP
jgi:hypothetical protein